MIRHPPAGPSRPRAGRSRSRTRTGSNFRSRSRRGPCSRARRSPSRPSPHRRGSTHASAWNRPATFTVTLPSTMTIHDSFGMSFANGERVFVPCEIDAGARTITTTLNQLGFTNPDDVQFTTGALSPDNFIDVDQMSCDIIRDALTDQILRAQAFSGPFPPDLASPLITEYRAALLVCTSLDSVSEASAALREYACANVNSSEATAGVAEITSVEDLRTNLGYLVAAEGMAQVFGADCHIQTATMEAVFDKYLDDYVDRINSPEFTRDRPTWDALWAENLVIV